MSSQKGRGSVNKQIWVVCSGKIGSSYFPSGPCFLVEKKGNSSSSPAMFQDVSGGTNFFSASHLMPKTKTFNKHGHQHHLSGSARRTEKKHMLLLLFGAQP